MIHASGLHQWRGLDPEERTYIEAVIARRERYDLGGCVNGDGLACGQITRPMWSCYPGFGKERLELVSIKEDLS
jgi:hypothetical protein